MAFTFEKTEIPEVVYVTPRVFGDDRGFFEETYKKEEFEAAGIKANFVQDNHSYSKRGVLRGMHWQKAPYTQGKLVSVVVGRIVDVAVDVRKGSPYFGKYVMRELSSENHAMLWIPEGFAHGFIVLSDEVHFLYKCTNVYNKASEAGFVWNDEDVGIKWPVFDDVCTSPKDLVLPKFKDIIPL